MTTPNSAQRRYIPTAGFDATKPSISVRSAQPRSRYVTNSNLSARVATSWLARTGAHGVPMKNDPFREATTDDVNRRRFRPIPSQRNQDTRAGKVSEIGDATTIRMSPALSGLLYDSQPQLTGRTTSRSPRHSMRASRYVGSMWRAIPGHADVPGHRAAFVDRRHMARMLGKRTSGRRQQPVRQHTTGLLGYAYRSPRREGCAQRRHRRSRRRRSMILFPWLLTPIWSRNGSSREVGMNWESGGHRFSASTLRTGSRPDRVRHHDLHAANLERARIKVLSSLTDIVARLIWPRRRSRIRSTRRQAITAARETVR